MILVRPALLLLLIPWLLWLYWYWRRQGQHGRWSRLFDPQLLDALHWRRGSGQAWLAWLSLGLAGVLLIIASAGPAWRYSQGASLAQGHLLVVLDNSASMAAEDVQPSRAVRAQRTVLDWAGSGLFQSTAVITYSGSAHWLTPFTRDVDTLAEQLNQLTPWLMPAFGNRPDLAFAQVQSRLSELELGRVHLLWITDDASPDQLEAIRNDLTHTGQTWIVPVGTDAGGPIPLPDGRGFLNDGSRMVVTRLSRDDFDQARSTLNASLLSLGAQPRSEWLADTQRQATTEPIVQEVGYWLLIPALLLLLPWYRRGLVYGLPLLLLLQAPESQAQSSSWVDSLLYNREQRALQALRDQRPEQAAALSERTGVQAHAAFAQGDYGLAAELWAQQGGLEGLYNLGNALAHQGDLEGAVEAYEAALAIEEHRWARDNFERVRAFLDQQPPPPPPPPEDSESPDSDPGDQEADQAGSRADPNEGQQEDAESDPARAEDPGSIQPRQEGPAQQDDALAEQSVQPDDRQRLQEQEIERLLNRIPQTPSSLLQRKFRYQYEQNPTQEEAT
ncbi:MAG: VWA domain-containing protein [Saccharospirillum sp.]